MRIVLKCVLVIGVLFGLHASILANELNEVLAEIHNAEDPGHHHHDDDLPEDSSHDHEGPQEHHHHGEFSHHLMSVATDLNSTGLLVVPSSQLLRMGWEHETIPDGPYLSSDRPPLI